MNSKLFSFDISDLAKGLLMSVLGALTGAISTALTNGGHIDWKITAYVAAGSGIAYLQKNFFSNSNGQPFTAEKQ